MGVHFFVGSLRPRLRCAPARSRVRLGVRTTKWRALNLTGKTSVSLGSDAYRRIIESAGLALMGEAEDDGQNHYYDVCKPESPACEA